MLVPSLPQEAAPPFALGGPVDARGYVHVFDDVSLNLVMRELDTISDFVEYLAKKERFIAEDRLVSAAGEEELLAYYLRKMNSQGQHDFVMPDGLTHLAIAEGTWRGYSRDPRYLAKKRADKASYLWDRLIEVFARHIATGTLAVGQDLPVSSLERALRVMASEARFSRRVLANALREKILTTQLFMSDTRTVISQEYPGVAYVFLISGPGPEEEYEEFRNARAAILLVYCKVARLLHRQLREVIGIAMEPRGSRGGSEALVYVAAESWTAEDEVEARALQDQFGIFKKARTIHTHDEEYPATSVVDDYYRVSHRRDHPAEER